MPCYEMPTGPLAGLRLALPLSLAFWSVVAIVIFEIV